MSARPFNPPFAQTKPNGRFWAKTDNLGQLPPELVQKLAVSMQNPDGEMIEFQGHFYRAEKSQDGKSMFLVQRTAQEVEDQKKRDQNGGGNWKKGGGGGRPVTLAADDFTVATVDAEVKQRLKEGWVFVVGEHGLQVGTMAVAGQQGGSPDVVNGLFMIKPKAAQ